MCLIAWSWQPRHARCLLLGANRDEWLARPTEPMHWWDAVPGVPPVLAGRDLQGGGTWLGIRRDGLLAALTNVRETGSREAQRPSRGNLAARFLQGRHPRSGEPWAAGGVPAWARELQRHMHEFAGFNLLLADLRRGEMVCVSNRAPLVDVEPGVHGLSNAALDTPWPKVLRLRQAVAHARDDEQDFESLLQPLLDPAPAEDSELPPLPPGMQLSREWNRGLSAAFIRLPDYGTRCSTLLRAHSDGSIQVLEQQHEADRARREFRWNWRD
ncbi:NRDE family protein [Metallibacterium scheffleri]|jgi:uncharacterized protein with NRDE domain|uniref:NRDE family protein n=1 Tax=Metallibacterium scheffleri TaxID=993689 RepID=UPI0026ECCE2D|nr:NRDE family protein [Metallibacterium scheffleri]MBW8076411.1 hypothetical protein [Metallibacterium scheffleri]